MRLHKATMRARRQQNDTFKVQKENHYQPKILYSAKISFKTKGKIKTFQTNKN